jgi:hypothetical protein
MTTWAADAIVLEQNVLADGSQQPLIEADCRGWQRSEWSATRRQLFMHAELECAGQPRRVVSGITLMTAGPTWIDIQALTVDRDQVVRVRQYQRAADQSSLDLPSDLAARAREEAQRLAAVPIAAEDVTEASSSRIASKAIEAMLVETNATFNLNGRELIRLQTAGVAPEVTDLMVALSFPERFIVEREGSFERASGVYSSYSSWFGSLYSSSYSASAAYPGYYYSPYGYSVFPYGYLPYSYTYSPYAYSPFAFFYWSNPYGARSFRVASPGGVRSTPPTETQTETGRAVAGRGYTRVRPRDEQGGAAQPGSVTSSSSGGQSSTGSSRSGTRSSGGGSASSGGYSRGGSGSSSDSSGGSSGGSSSGGANSSGGSGRTAQPR